MNSIVNRQSDNQVTTPKSGFAISKITDSDKDIKNRSKFKHTDTIEGKSYMVESVTSTK